MAMVCEQNREVQAYYTNQIAGNQTIFVSSFVLLLLLLLFFMIIFIFSWAKTTHHLDLNTSPDARDMIKACFAAFSQELEQLVQACYYYCYSCYYYYYYYYYSRRRKS